MKTIKRILSVLLALLTIFSIVSVNMSYAAEKYGWNIEDGEFYYPVFNEKDMKLSGDFYYTVDEDGTAIIQKVVDKSYAGKTLVIPAKIDGHKVKGMYVEEYLNDPFSKLKKSGNIDTITSVKVEEGIKQLLLLGVFNYPESSPYFDEYAPKAIKGIFSEMKNLVKVSLPSTLRAVDPGMFSYCSSLKSITIPDNVEFIDESAFLGCSSLKSVKLSRKLKRIYLQAFRDCVSLESVDITKNVETIEGGAFRNCKSLKSVKLPQSLAFIGGGAFKNCKKLKKITLPSGLVSIGSGAFWGCDSLEGKMKLPKKLKEVGDGAFAFCYGLTGFRIADGNKYFSQKGGVLFNKKKTKIYCYLSGKETKEYKIPSTVKSVSRYAFAGTKHLNKLTFSDKITKIPEDTFYESKVKHIVFSKSVKEIKDDSLSHNKSLRSLTVKNKKCKMPGHWDYKGKKITVYGYKNSTAQTFAKKAKLKFVKLK